MQSISGNDMAKDFLGYLPELPDVMAQFIELTRQLNTTKTSYANILLSDQILSTRIFSYINLVLNTSKTDYLSINKGISLMGLHMFKNVVLAFSLYPAFEDAGCIELFKYSLSTAYYSKEIALQFKFINPHDAFLLGFLHDIGKLALKNKFKDEYKFTTHNVLDIEKQYTIEEELAKFNYCHSDLGEYICKTWNLPIVVTDAIRFHHYPLDAMLPQAASIIYLSDILAHKNMRITPEDMKIFQYMQLSKSDIMPYSIGQEKKLMPYFEILGI